MKSYTIDEILSRTSNLVLLENQKEYREHLVQFIRMHLLRVEAIGNGKPVASLPIISSLVIASSGTGKSFLMSEIAKAAGINVITVDCSNLSRAGWKGVNLGTLLYSELKRLKDKEKFETSVIHFDEFDKLKISDSYADVGNPQVNLLRVFDGKIEAEINSYESISLDTSRMSFVFSGAFAGLEEIIKERISPSKIGFFAENSFENNRNLFAEVTTEDLFQYGIMKELLGRIGSTITIGKLSEDDYKLLLNGENGSVCERYNNLFSNLGVKIEVSDRACCNIATQLNDNDLGARALFPLVFGKVISSISNIENDPTINRVILDFSEDRGLLVSYKHGERTPNIVAKKTIPTVKLPKMNFAYLFDSPLDIEEIADIFMDFYKEISDENVDLMRCFIICSLYYMKYECNDSDVSIENFYTLATCLSDEKADKSTFDMLIRSVMDSKRIDKEDEEIMRVYYNEFHMIIDHGTSPFALISSAKLLCRECYKHLLARII